MGWKFEIDVNQVVDAPQQVLWDRVSNHDGTAQWVKRWVKRVAVQTPGTEDRNGVGAIRGLPGWPERTGRVRAVFVDRRPQVTDHLEVRTDDRSEVAWKVNLEFEPALSAPALVKQMGVSGRFSWRVFVDRRATAGHGPPRRSKRDPT